mmetsp:Transcript_44521/g.32625  ORF Transcript_44521/g.32625 Transcript_44521/m.32625 type:complete len:97 (+) Transcript_44521:329-619(+)
MSSSSIQTTCYSIFVNFYPEDREALIGYIEAVTGLGAICGPMIGSLLFTVGGFSFAYFSFGMTFLFFSVVVKKILSSKVDAVRSMMSEREEHRTML